MVTWCLCTYGLRNQLWSTYNFCKFFTKYKVKYKVDQNKWLNIFVWPFLFRKCKWINIRYPSYSIFVPFGKTVFWWSLLVLSKKWIFESEFFWFRKSTSFFRMSFSIGNLGKLIWVEILTSLPILWLSSSLYLGPQKINLLKYVPKWSILF